MSMFGIDQLPVKPRMRGWIHVYAFGVAVVVGVALTVLAFSVVSVSAGAACAVYAVTVCRGVRRECDLSSNTLGHRGWSSVDEAS